VQRCCSPGIAATTAANGGNAVNETNKMADAVALPDAETFVALVRRADRGEREALAAVRSLAVRLPDLWEALGGDLARDTQRALLRAMVGARRVTREAIEHQMSVLRRELLGSQPTSLERLLVERICTVWLQMHHADAMYIASLRAEMTHDNGVYLQEQVDRAQKRYLAAIRALAQVRKLLAPTVQINVAQQQVNVGGPQVNVAAMAQPVGAVPQASKDETVVPGYAGPASDLRHPVE
jgi:hypothetical protein